MTSDQKKNIALYLTMLVSIGSISTSLIRPYFIDPAKERDQETKEIKAQIKELRNDFEKVVESYEYQNLMELSKHVKKEHIKELFKAIEETHKREIDLKVRLSQIDGKIEALNNKDLDQDSHIKNLFYYKLPKGAYDY